LKQRDTRVFQLLADWTSFALLEDQRHMVTWIVLCSGLPCI